MTWWRLWWQLPPDHLILPAWPGAQPSWFGCLGMCFSRGVSAVPFEPAAVSQVWLCCAWKAMQPLVLWCFVQLFSSKLRCLLTNPTPANRAVLNSAKLLPSIRHPSPWELWLFYGFKPLGTAFPIPSVWCPLLIPQEGQWGCPQKGSLRRSALVTAGARGAPTSPSLHGNDRTQHRYSLGCVCSPGDLGQLVPGLV